MLLPTLNVKHTNGFQVFTHWKWETIKDIHKRKYMPTVVWNRVFASGQSVSVLRLRLGKYRETTRRYRQHIIIVLGVSLQSDLCCHQPLPLDDKATFRALTFLPLAVTFVTFQIRDRSVVSTPRTARSPYTFFRRWARYFWTNIR